MKILFIVPWYPTEKKPLGGVFFREQARALAARGHCVAVFHPDLRFDLDGGQPGFFYRHNTGVAEYTLRRRNLTPFCGAGIIAQRTQMLLKLYHAYSAKYGRPDVVHLHCCELAYEAGSLCRRYGLPLVYTEHYSGVLGTPGRLLRGKLRFALKKSLYSLAVSESLRTAMSRYGGPIIVVPNGIDIRQFTLKPSPARQNFVFGAMGSLVPVKGHALLLRAFAQALPQLDGALLRLGGDGPEKENLTRLATELGIADSVIFEGEVPRDKAPDFYNGSDCVVCSSYRETFGVVLIEALACGRPVVSTRCGGPEDIIGKGDGILCEPGDQNSLARALVSMRQTSGTYRPEEIRRGCAARFSWEAVCSRLEKIYQNASAPIAGQSHHDLSATD